MFWTFCSGEADGVFSVKEERMSLEEKGSEKSRGSFETIVVHYASVSLFT